MLEIVVHTNNGVERKNRDFKYECLRQYKDDSVSGIVTVLAEHGTIMRVHNSLCYSSMSRTVFKVFVFPSSQPWLWASALSLAPGLNFI